MAYRKHQIGVGQVNFTVWGICRYLAVFNVYARKFMFKKYGAAKRNDLLAYIFNYIYKIVSAYMGLCKVGYVFGRTEIDKAL